MYEYCYTYTWRHIGRKLENLYFSPIGNIMYGSIVSCRRWVLKCTQNCCILNRFRDIEKKTKKKLMIFWNFRHSKSGCQNAGLEHSCWSYWRKIDYTPNDNFNCKMYNMYLYGFFALTPKMAPEFIELSLRFIDIGRKTQRYPNGKYYVWVYRDLLCWAQKMASELLQLVIVSEILTKNRAMSQREISYMGLYRICCGEPKNGLRIALASLVSQDTNGKNWKKLKVVKLGIWHMALMYLVELNPNLVSDSQKLVCFQRYWSKTCIKLENGVSFFNCHSSGPSSSLGTFKRYTATHGAVQELNSKWSSVTAK